MSRPKVQKFKPPTHIRELPVGPAFPGGHLIEINAGMRTFRPIINKEKCSGCFRCFLVCPEGVIFKTGDKVDIDYDYCKGCGICEFECRFEAISMVKEGE
ncbi:MAG: 4Fe-4S binding protein [Dethiobacteria bacterium]|jgi:pyruvate ferredoxin oxidoreductase delta subunit|nr:4Fe-4S binding protein [Bacillota bacterium]